MSHVRFSPDEQFLAVVAGGGTLVLWELHLSHSGVCKVGEGWREEVREVRGGGRR